MEVGFARLTPLSTPGPTSNNLLSKLIQNHGDKMRKARDKNMMEVGNTQTALTDFCKPKKRARLCRIGARPR